MLNLGGIQCNTKNYTILGRKGKSADTDNFPEVYDVVFTTGAVSVLVSKYLDMYCIQGPSKLCRSHNKQ